MEEGICGRGDAEQHWGWALGPGRPQAQAGEEGAGKKKKKEVRKEEGRGLTKTN